MRCLCRPDEAETDCVAHFCEECEVAWVTKKNDDEVSPFKPRCGDSVHPSVTKSKDGQVKVQQGVRVRDVPALFCVPEFMFPDTASFQADIAKRKENYTNVLGNMAGIQHWQFGIFWKLCMSYLVGVVADKQ